MKKVLVDMSCTLLHHGHIRILKIASEFGRVIVALTTDEEVLKNKGYLPELSYSERREILMAIQYVDDVIPSDWLIDDDFIAKNNVDLLIHGDDNTNEISSCDVKIVPRTENISSNLLRQRGSKILKSLS